MLELAINTVAVFLFLCLFVCLCMKICCCYYSMHLQGERKAEAERAEIKRLKDLIEQKDR